MNEYSNVSKAFRVVGVRYLEKEKELKSDIEDLTSNQYISVTVKNGGIHQTETLSRSLGYYTLGLSMLFTSKMIVVKGTRTPENVRCLQRIWRDNSCYIEDELTI